MGDQPETPDIKPKKRRNGGGNRRSRKVDAEKSGSGGKQRKNRIINHHNNDKKNFRVLEVIRVIRQFNVVQVNGKELKSKKESINLVESLGENDDIYLVINLVPSDPEFPFDLSSLKISLSVPTNYPMKKNSPHAKNNRPSIMVLNAEIPKGISVNIERGFNRIAANICSNPPISAVDDGIDIQISGGNNLYGCLTTLDKYLADFLAQKKKDTIRIVKRVSNKNSSAEKRNIAEDEELNEAGAVNILLNSGFASSNAHTTAPLNAANNSSPELDKILELVRYKLSRQTGKFELINGANKFGLEYKFVIEGSNAKIAHLPPDFNANKIEPILRKNLTAVILFPFDYTNSPIKISKLSAEGLIANHKNAKPEKFEKITFEESTLAKFLNNVISSFNSKSHNILNANRGSILSLLNYLEANLIELGLGSKLI